MRGISGPPTSAPVRCEFGDGPTPRRLTNRTVVTVPSTLFIVPAPSTSHAARCVACQGVRSHPVPGARSWASAPCRS
jgi:hypothetical protein